MASDLERQVAEAKCLACQGHKRTKLLYSEGPCEPCNETGLRFPPLSRECRSEKHDPCKEEFTYTVDGMSYYEEIDVPSCGGSRRVSDVTLEKVLDATHEIGSIVCLNVMAAIGAWYSGLSKQSTPTDAACAALLAEPVAKLSTQKGRRDSNPQPAT